MKAQNLLIGLWMAAVLLLLALLLAALGPINLGDIPLYSIYAHRMAAGQLPYSGFNLEYPPGVVPFIFLALPLGGLMTGSYPVGFMVLSMAAAGTILAHRYQVAGRRGLLVAALLLVPLLQFVFFDLDVFSAISLYVAVYGLRRRQYGLSAVSLAVSTLIKAYPGVCLLGLIWVVPPARRRRYLLTFGGVLAAVLVPVMIAAPRGLWYALTYHTGRPIEFEASGAAIGFVLHLFGGMARIAASHDSRVLLFGGQSLVNALSSLGLLAALVGISVTLWRRRRQSKPAVLSLILLLVFIIFFKVGSPQYMVPVLFIVPLAADELGKRLYKQLVVRSIILAAVIWLLFIVLFRSGTQALGPDAWAVTLLSVGRVVLLVEMVVFLGRCLERATPVDN